MPIKIRPIRIEGNDAFVTLSNGRETVFDADKVHLVEGYNWTSDRKGYAYRDVRENGKRRKISLHRLLAGAPDGVIVDHIDMNIENDRCTNLRHCTQSQNQANRGANKNNSSGFKGITAHRGKWQAKIKVNWRDTYLGLYATREEAHAAYVEAAIKHFGEFSRASAV